MRSQIQLKPQDILVLLKLHFMNAPKRPRLMDIAIELGMSISEVSQAIKRAAYAGLCDEKSGKPFPSALKEFVLHGIKYAYPVQPGKMTIGMPTAHSAKPLKKLISSKDVYVWPHPEGKARGQAIRPLFASAPKAAEKDPELYEALALIDALRVGSAREKNMAVKELEKRLS